MATLAELNVVIGAQIDEFESAMDKVQADLGSLGDYAKAAATGIGVALTALAGLGAKAVTTAGDIQALEKGFAATYNGALPLADALAKVRDLAKLPGLGLKEALQGATNLQAAGFSADLATRALGAFGNALATVGKGKADLDGVGLALSQIASKGKISAEEINQLAERVPQIRQAMVAAFGTADTQVLQKSKISATDFVTAITAQLEKLPKVTGGINNAFENLSDASTIALAKLGTSINNAFDIEGKANLLTSALTKVGDAFASLEPEFRAVAAYFGADGEGGRLFSDLAASVSDSAGEISNAFAALNGGENSLSGIKSLIREISVGFTALSDVVGGTIGTITRAFQGDFVGSEKEAERALYGLIDPLANLFGFTKKGAEDAGKSLAAAFDPLKDAPDYFSDIEAPILKVVAAATEAQKALDKLLKALRTNGNESIALGRDYDFLGNRQKVLESGIKSLISAGWNPAGATVQKYVAQLRELNQVLGDNSLLQTRVAKGLEKANVTPDLTVKAPDFSKTDNALLLPDYNKIFNDAATAVSTGYLKVNAALSKGQVDSAKAALAFNEQLESVLVGGLQQVAVGIGEAVGSILAGTGGLNDIGAAILGPIGEVAVKLGELAIGVGLGVLGINAALETLNPYVAIAAGVALVALGSYAKSKAASLSSSGGGGASLASQPKTNYNSSAANTQQTIKVQVVGELYGRGADLVAVLKTEDYRNQRTR